MFCWKVPFGKVQWMVSYWLITACSLWPKAHTKINKLQIQWVYIYNYIIMSIIINRIMAVIVVIIIIIIINC